MTIRVLFMLALVGLITTLPLQGQPGGGRGGMGGMRNVQGGGIEQSIAFLMFDEKVALTDQQLIKLRAALKDKYARQREVGEQIRAAMEEAGADFGAVRETMMSMRETREQLNEEVKVLIAGVLNEDQAVAFEKHQREQQQMRRGFGGGRGRGQWGGGG